MNKTTIARRRVILNQANAVQADLDWLAWVIGVTVASLLRVDFDLDKLMLWGQVAVVPLVGACHLVVAAIFGLYDGRFLSGSFEEAVAVAKTAVLTMPLVFLVVLVASDPRMVPLGATVGGAAIALACMCGTRWLERLRLERRHRPVGPDVGRLLVIGAGEGGEQVLTSMLRDPDGRYVPVAILDDDPLKQNLRLRGVPVVGTTDRLVEAASATGATTVLVAIPTASRDVIRKITAQANEADLVVKVLPSVRELLDGTVDAGDIRDVTPADLLGRHEISTDIESVAGYVSGRRVLVTGAGGSIGAELCRQLSGLEPAELVMLDRDESSLHAVQLSITGRALLDTPDVVLCDIRDTNALRAVFDRVMPEVVFHAAALKHLPMLERYPAEGWKTNVIGTQNVLDASARVGVGRFVNISTDKAADPTSVLGFSKRVAERLTSHVATSGSGSYVSVRFGNVLGSRGSMLDTFASQILSGGPVTVTHPDVTRFFMTIAEACELVIQAGAFGGDGEVHVLDMGSPVRIADVAQQLIAQSRADIDVVYTGLRAGEKLHEVLLGEGEPDLRRHHPLISEVAVPPLDPDVLPNLAGCTPDEVASALVELCRLSSGGADATSVTAGSRPPAS